MRCLFTWLILGATVVGVVPGSWVCGADPFLTQIEPQDELTPDGKDWPWWRGPHRNGHANADQQPPTEWSEDTHVVWKTPVPGKGHGTPTVAGPHVFLAIGDHERDVQTVACYDRATGKLLWETIVHRSGLMVKNEKSSAASSTVAVVGDRLFINFLNAGAVTTSALDRQGKLLWQTKISDYIIHQGYGSSPTVYRHLVISSADNKGGGAVAAMDQKSGEIIWRRERPKTPNYPSPMVLRVAGRDQVVLVGCDRVVSYDPLTGETIWEMDGATTECVTSTITDGQHIYTSGGYPTNHLAAIRADGSKSIAWKNDSRVYVPSMLIHDGHLFAVLDAGVAMCWNSATGEERWKSRLGGTFSASPVLVGDRIYATNESGETFVYRANWEKFELLSKNKLGDEMFASAVICDSRIYMRVARFVEGRRQEELVCIGQ